MLCYDYKKVEVMVKTFRKLKSRELCPTRLITEIDLTSKQKDSFNPDTQFFIIARKNK